MLENNEIKEEIASRFDEAISNGEDELDVYSEMLEKGIDVDTVRKCCGNTVADSMKSFVKNTAYYNNRRITVMTIKQIWKKQLQVEVEIVKDVPLSMLIF